MHLETSNRLHQWRVLTSIYLLRAFCIDRWLHWWMPFDLTRDTNRNLSPVASLSSRQWNTWASQATLWFWLSFLSLLSLVVAQSPESLPAPLSLSLSMTTSRFEVAEASSRALWFEFGGLYSHAYSRPVSTCDWTTWSCFGDQSHFSNFRHALAACDCEGIDWAIA